MQLLTVLKPKKKKKKYEVNKSKTLAQYSNARLHINTQCNSNLLEIIFHFINLLSHNSNLYWLCSIN